MKDKKNESTREFISSCIKKLMDRKVEVVENYVKKGDENDDLPIMSMDLRINVVAIPKSDEENIDVATEFERLVTYQVLLALEHFLDKYPECDATAFCDKAGILPIAKWGAVEYTKMNCDCL